MIFYHDNMTGFDRKRNFKKCKEILFILSGEIYLDKVD